MSVNTGKYVADQQQDGDDFSEVGYRISRENDKIDSKYGFDRVKDTLERTGYLINMHSTEILDDDRRLISALDLFFMQMDGSRFKSTIVYQPYLLVLPRPKHTIDITRFLSKKYAGQISKIETVHKEDLDLANHLIGIQQEYIQIWFPNYNAMIKVRREIMSAVRKNRDREKSNTEYMKMLSKSLVTAASEMSGSANGESNFFKSNEQLENIIDIREYDVPYHVRVSIDLKINCGLWYSIRQRGITELPVITPRPDIIERPEPIILAYDIETTKLPLKFPDAQTDQIMMISYMIDGQGFLITNRDIISHDVADFEYTPKPEFEGNFVVFNEENEFALIRKFFDHIMDIRPHVIVTYNGDFFDWPFVETRAAVYDLDMKQEIGYSKSRDGNYLCRPSMHMDCLCWVKRDSYLPVGSQGLKAVAKAKLRYDPVELDPEDMCRMAIEQPQVLSNYSVSDAVATYYLYMKYVNPFIFALATIIPMEPDEVLRKGSGTLCETLLMVQAYHANIVFPNKQQGELNKLSDDGHVLDSETYVGGHVEALESGVFRSDIPCRFRVDPEMIIQLKNNVHKVLQHAIEIEEGIPLSDVINFQETVDEIQNILQNLHDIPNRLEQPVIFHLDVGAMYPNIILTNRLQPSSMVSDVDCAACDFNKPDAKCKRSMEWMWRGEMLPASKNEFQRIQQQLETEKFPPLFPNGPTRSYHELSKIDQAAYEKQRLTNYCRKAYKKVKITRLETRCSTICQKENSFYVDTVRAFRDRRYEYKGLTKVAKSAVTAAVASGDASEIKAAKGREVLYDSLQLAHKCILNSFYGYVMRRGARWHSMSMAGIVCLTGANIIMKAREIIEKVGRPLELDTDGIWCILPASFPQEFTIHTNHQKKKKINISYPNAVLNTMVKDHFTNDQYHELIKPSAGKQSSSHLPEYELRNENSIFFEVDGPYLAMVLPAAKEEGKRLKKRYAVFNFDGSLAELKGFEVKRRGELQLIKIFQSSVFESFLHGTTLEECYASVAKVADYWLDVLYSKGNNMPDTELFELISENRSMSKKLEDYGGQKSTSISTAKRLAEFLGDQMVKDAGLACKYIISRKPEGSPVTERAIPLAIFQSEISVRRHYLKRWLKDNTMGDADIREVLDWNYYIERLGGTIQKIITIPAALQGLNNPVPRVPYPEWLHKRMLEKNDVLKQRRINEIFMVKPKPPPNTAEADGSEEMRDIEDIIVGNDNDGRSRGIPMVTKRKRTNSNSETEQQPNSEQQQPHKTWKEALGPPPVLGKTREEIVNWVIYQKKKWEWQRQRRFGSTNNNNNNRNQKEKEKQKKRFKPSKDSGDADQQAIGPVHRSTATLGGFLKRAQRNLIESSWQIIQIIPVGNLGNFTLWAMIGDELHKIKLYIPRKFYVNQRTNLIPGDDEMGDSNDSNKKLWKKVHRVLPRSRPVYYLYQYSVSEDLFRENRLAMLTDLATPDIEGIYETQMSLEFRALLELGCVCSVQRSEARQLLAKQTKDIDSFTIEQLEFRTVTHQPYLQTDQLKHIFMYQHSSVTGKREMWGIFLVPIKKAHIIVLDTVRSNQMPTLKNLYATELKTFMERMQQKHNENLSEKLQPPNELNFQISMEIESTIVYKQIQQILQSYRNERKTPTMLCVQTTYTLSKLNIVMPIMLDFPQTQIHIADDASLLSGLEWQRTGVRTVIRHFLNVNIVIAKMLDQCRYFHLPIGNMPNDPVLFGADLFFGRYLQKNNFVLWTSPTARPDLGGREADDSRLLAEFEDNITVVQNKPGYYDNVCVELAIDSLAVSALLQASKIQELEGASSAVTFDVIQQASLDDMIGQNTAVPLPSYDETALCSAAFRIMRTMVNGWLREVSVHRNIYADFQIVHFYRWIRSANSLLYDPALRRSLNNLMRKLFLQIVAEFQRLGAIIIYADFNKIILNTKKQTVTDAIGYTDYIVSNIRNKELFHSVHLSYQKSWKFILWLDTVNYSGVRGKLTKSAKENVIIINDENEDENNGQTEEDQQDGNEENEEEIAIELNWNIGEYLPEVCQEHFETILTYFIQHIAEQCTPEQSITRITHIAYDITQKLHKHYGHGPMTERPALHFINALCKILLINANIVEEVEVLRRNMLRLIGVGEFSDMAMWKDPLNSYILNEVFCKACNHCRDIDLCRDKDVALKDGIPVWLCSQCTVYYDNDEMEVRLLETVNRKIMSYTLQDLRCVRCKQIKRENLIRLCSCAGQYETLINANELKQLLQAFLKIAIDHKMILLEEHIQWTLNNT